MIIEDEYIPSIRKDFGIDERAKKGNAGFGQTHLQETIWNFGNTQLVNIEDVDIVDVIEKYQKQTGKSAIWRGAKSTPFLKFLKEYNQKNKISPKKEIIELGLDEDEDIKEDKRIRYI